MRWSWWPHCSKRERSGEKRKSIFRPEEPLPLFTKSSAQGLIRGRVLATAAQSFSSLKDASAIFEAIAHFASFKDVRSKN